MSTGQPIPIRSARRRADVFDFLKLRYAAGLTAPQAAAALNVSYQTVWRWETGRHPIPRMAFMALELIVLRGKA